MFKKKTSAEKSEKEDKASPKLSQEEVENLLLESQRREEIRTAMENMREEPYYRLQATSLLQRIAQGIENLTLVVGNFQKFLENESEEDSEDGKE